MTSAEKAAILAEAKEPELVPKDMAAHLAQALRDLCRKVEIVEREWTDSDDWHALMASVGKAKDLLTVWDLTYGRGAKK